MTIRRKTAVLMTAAALATTGAAMAQPAAAAAPVFAGGLVNVNVSDVDVLNDSLNQNDVRILNNLDVLNDNNVGVGVVAQVAAVVCDTNVGGILGELRDTGTATCEAGQDAGSIVFTVVE